MAEDKSLNYGDILSQIVNLQINSLQESVNSSLKSATTDADKLRYLASIDTSLRKLAGGASQSAARTQVFGHNGSFGTKYDEWSGYSGGSKSSFKFDTKSPQQIGREFLEGLQDSLLEGFLGSDFKDRMQEAAKGFADKFGYDISDIPKHLSKELGQRALSAFKNTSAGKALASQISGVFNNVLSILGGSASSAAGSVAGGIAGAGSSTMAGFAAAGGAATAGSAGAAAGGAALLPLLGSLAVAIAPLLPLIAAVAAILYVVGPAIEGFVAVFKSQAKAAKRNSESAERDRELAQERLKADVESMVKYPFEILKRAAEDFQSVWDQNLRTITATQGYTKSDLQDLIASFSDRLRHEGLTSVVSSTDITSSLAKVLEAGLSGKIAEEFAYQATKLGAAIPTQDFFGYAATYSSIAANAVKEGKSQTQAIQLATDSLYEFANNVLYASRELSGGFTTGLKDAQSLYEQAVKITQAAGVGDVAKVSGVFTAVAGIVGATAPDLANSITDTIYKAATGGNASDIVALRSLAGINASNTEFLRALARDPQGVFTAMFRNLAAMYTSSGDAFMEKAEAYAGLFGLSSEAFQRIDFNYLAQAISEMNVDSGALSDNIELLRSGQTTQTQEQLKIAQINKFAIEEGLAYVLDNEVARSIQEHMWDEQIAREIQEATYAVEVQGAAATFIQKIAEFVERIASILNPAAWLSRTINNIVQTNREAIAQQEDLVALLELGVVGQGNRQDLYNLTTRNAYLDLIPDVLTLMGGSSRYASIEQQRRITNAMLGGFRNSASLHLLGSRSELRDGDFYSGEYSPQSSYRWNILGKSTASSSSRLLLSPGADITRYRNAVQSATRSAQDSVSNVIKEMLSDEYIEGYIKEGATYEEWKSSARGVSDFSKAAYAAGYDEAELEKYYYDKQTEYGRQLTQEMKQKEQDFYDKAVPFVETRFWDEFNSPLVKLLEVNFENILSGFDTVTSWQAEFGEYFEKKFASAWESHWKEYSNYYIRHQIYGGGSLSLQTLEAVAKSEREGKGDVANALSEYLTRNNWNLDDLKDPQVQANMLLSQILVVLNAIMNQNNKSAGSLSLMDSLSGLALGGTYTSKIG